MKDLFGPLSDEVRNLRILPGISSVQMLAARLQEPWQDWLLVSGHGVSCDVLQYLMQGKKIFMLTGGDLTPDVICSQLVQAGLGDLGVYVASDLSCGDRMYVEKCADQRTAAETLETCDGGTERTDIAGETICRGTASDFAHRKFPIMSVMLIDAAPVWRGYAAGIPDAEFIRGNVPMTKQEVRSVILAKLAPCRNDVVWDVGAGTGSVSVELAHHAGSVWAFEKKKDAIDLIYANRRKFCAWNLRVVPGSAPEVFRGSGSKTHERPLNVETEQPDIYEGSRNTETEHPGQCVFPVPDRVFIGGSSGNLSEIIRYIARLNPEVRICVSAVLLETLHETLEIFDELGFETDAVQVAVTRTEKIAGRRMMKAGNPVWIITGSRETVLS
jgi:precorrin-6Y C5,15-methyltransferase (decarboxylating)